MVILRLLHLCDSLFPIGAFGYSDGLEASGVADPDALRAWIDVCLDETIGHLDAPTVWRAWDMVRRADWDALASLDAESTALRPSAGIRRATRAMGLRLLTTWQTLYPHPGAADLLALARSTRIGPALPIAFAAASACADVDRRIAVEAFAYTRLASTVSAAMRLMPVGQTEAHLLLARALDRVPDVVGAAAARDRDPESFTPLVDIASMRHQYLHSRLFRT